MILVTGATGNVGRPLVAQLLARGAKVRTISLHPNTAGLPGDGSDMISWFDDVSASPCSRQN